MSEKQNRNLLDKFTSGFAQNYLWLIGLGLMLASAGVDGVYLQSWQPTGFWWLGQILNTTADVSGMIITYTFGKLRQSKSETRRKRAKVLMWAEFVAVGFSWLFSWRQLVIVLPTIEPVAWPWLAPLSAAFIPALLAFLGYAQSLHVDEYADERGAVDAPEVVILRQELAELRQEFADRPKIKCNRIIYRQLVAKANGDAPGDSAEAREKFILERGYDLPVAGVKGW